MTITSFSNPEVSYEATSTSCQCPDRQFRHHACKHMRKASRIEQGSPTTVSEARQARIARNRATANAYYRMSFSEY